MDIVVFLKAASKERFRCSSSHSNADHPVSSCSLSGNSQSCILPETSRRSWPVKRRRSIRFLAGWRDRVWLGLQEESPTRAARTKVVRKSMNSLASHSAGSLVMRMVTFCHALARIDWKLTLHNTRNILEQHAHSVMQHSNRIALRH